MTLTKFNSQDAWNDFDNDISPEEAVKAERGRMIDVYSGPLTITNAVFKFDEKSQKDEQFFKFNITVTTPNNESRDIYSYWSLKTFRYGDKKTPIFAVQWKKLIRALGVEEEFSISAADKRQALAFQKKYMAFDENGVLQNLIGLQFYGEYAYKDGSYTLKKDKDTEKPWFIADAATGLPAIFPKIKRLKEGIGADGKPTLTDVFEHNVQLRGATMDSVKADATQNGIKTGMSDLVTQRAIPGINAQLLAERFGQNVKVLPVTPTASITDAQALVTGSDDDFGFDELPTG